MNRKTLFWVKLIFGVGILLVISAPILLTLSGGLIDFSSTGEIGDTIGGTTAPIVSLLGSALVFYALKAQIDANTLIQNQLKDQKKDEIRRKITSNINGQIDFLSKEIDNFRILERKNSSPMSKVSQVHYIELKGSSAILELIKKRIAHLGDTDSTEKLFSDHPELKLFYFILLTFSNILDSIENSKIDEIDKKYFRDLLAYLFEAKIIPGFHVGRVKDFNDEPPCEKCGKKHQGVPSVIFHLVEVISEKIEGANIFT
tara:strand:- start:6045 stop:6818 length:774 start_codon:yes stop_codon:yes gene_type:complete